MTAARLQDEEEWKLSALQLSLPLCQFIQLEGDIINLLHPLSARHLTTTPGQNREENTQGHLRFFDVLLRCIFVDS